MDSVEFVRYGEATKDNLNVIFWKTWRNQKAYITLTMEWYMETGLHPLDAMRLYVKQDRLPGNGITGYTPFEYMPRMYTIPAKQGIACVNASGDPFDPYTSEGL